MGGTSMRSTGNGSRRRRILVVDDEPAFAELMADFFSGLPGSPSVTVAGDGPARPHAGARGKPDGGLLSLERPVVKGAGGMQSMDADDPTLPRALMPGTDHPP